MNHITGLINPLICPAPTRTLPLHGPLMWDALGSSDWHPSALILYLPDIYTCDVQGARLPSVVKSCSQGWAWCMILHWKGWVMPQHASIISTARLRNVYAEQFVTLPPTAAMTFKTPIQPIALPLISAPLTRLVKIFSWWAAPLSAFFLIIKP